MPPRRRKEAPVTCNLHARPAAVLAIIAVLGCGGCERSQPGPKPISGTASGVLPSAAPAATPSSPANPSGSAGQPR
ncbi:hypothetical protein; putative exported protein [Cupriavidus taiwanensis]|uniref:Lipoprotein n=1 Tax=Cupriavidus taiwanensis TaxID=164546 RepID=A0A375CE45_9BURK|nr:hypothetical protein; putative exported protein [Cupriavidus taiwanensis]